MHILSCNISDDKVYTLSMKLSNGIIEKVSFTKDGLYSICYESGDKLVTRSGRVLNVTYTNSDRDRYILFDSSEDHFNRKERIYFDQIKAIKDITPIDAYRIAINHGFKGTVEEWLNYLKGEKGDTPKKGIDYWTEDDINSLYETINADIKEAVGESYDTLINAAENAKKYAENAKASELSSKECEDTVKSYKDETLEYKNIVSEAKDHIDSVKTDIDATKVSIDQSKEFIENAVAEVDTNAKSANSSKIAAEAAQIAAETAQSSAASARTAAETAQTAAETASYNANQAKSDVEVFKNNAENAATTAGEYKDSAEAAKTEAEASKTAAEGIKEDILAIKDETINAKTAAEAAKTAAKTSETNAKTSETNSKASETAAEAAQTAAEAAQASAEGARDTAVNAKELAETAKNSAESAKDAAVTAQTKAESAKADAEAAKSEVTIALSEAKTAQNNAKISETNAAESRTKAEEAKTEAVNSRDYAYNSQLAAEAAKTAAETAQGKTEDAQAAAETAKTAAKTSETNAKTSETNSKASETAAETAQTAAEAARDAAQSSATTAESNKNESNTILENVRKAGTDAIDDINAIKDTLKGDKGDSGVYVGSGDMPEGYNVQVDPNGEDTEDTSVLYNKVWYCCGDSFSEGDFTNAPAGSVCKFEEGKYAGLNKVYSRFIALRHSMKLNLLAKCGATVGLRNDDTQYSNASFNPLTDTPSNTNNFFYNQLPKIGNDADYITLWFGINDSGHCDLGTISDETVNTFYGALNWSMLYLITNFPMAHIGLIVSNRCNSNYKKAVRDVAQKWAIPYLDMEGSAGVPAISGTRENQDIPVDPRVASIRWNYFKVSDTNEHPNEKAHEYQSTFIENFLYSL